MQDNILSLLKDQLGSSIRLKKIHQEIVQDVKFIVGQKFTLECTITVKKIKLSLHSVTLEFTKGAKVIFRVAEELMIV